MYRNTYTHIQPALSNRVMVCIPFEATNSSAKSRFQNISLRIVQPSVNGISLPSSGNETSRLRSPTWLHQKWPRPRANAGIASPGSEGFVENYGGILHILEVMVIFFGGRVVFSFFDF